MRKIGYALLALSTLFALFFTAIAPVAAAGPQWIVVRRGDTLAAIAGRTGVSVSALMRANSLPNANFVYTGQRLLVPANGAPASPGASNSPSANASANGGYYTVRPGDTLFSIASRYGVSVGQLAQANGLWNYNFVFSGQRLRIPGGAPITSVLPVANPAPANPNGATSPAAPPVAPPASPNASTGGKWIDVNLTNETITAYEGSNAVKSVLVSTGTRIHPTVVGQYHIYAKYSAITMSGGTPGVDYYHLPNVPWTMFFFRGYAIHGTYWHHNFGHPMSHGCVNLTIADAKWFFDWAPQGTLVVSHY